MSATQHELYLRRIYYYHQALLYVFGLRPKIINRVDASNIEVFEAITISSSEGTDLNWNTVFQLLGTHPVGAVLKDKIQQCLPPSSYSHECYQWLHEISNKYYIHEERKEYIKYVRNLIEKHFEPTLQYVEAVIWSDLIKHEIKTWDTVKAVYFPPLLLQKMEEYPEIMAPRLLAMPLPTNLRGHGWCLWQQLNLIPINTPAYQTLCKRVRATGFDFMLPPRLDETNCPLLEVLDHKTQEAFVSLLSSFMELPTTEMVMSELAALSNSAQHYEDLGLVQIFPE